MKLSRRDFLFGGVAAASAPLIPSLPSGTRPYGRFRFVHFSDPHIQPELGAADGVKMAVRKVLSLDPRPDFVVTGGDHVMDVLPGKADRAETQFALLAEALKPLEMPIYGVIGNHDVFGWGSKEADQHDVRYGKAMVEDKILGAAAYRSFDHGGWHFALLDSIQHSELTGWHGAVDEKQMDWLESDLAKAGKANKIVVCHVPALTVFPQYDSGTGTKPTDTLILANGKQVQELCRRHSVEALLQGHTHVVEECEYAGTRYITGGAVCGDWWKGPRRGIDPEGFMVYDIDGDRLTRQYVPYGWKARGE